jgi:FAD/FMN-containing dehydrogenase
VGVFVGSEGCFGMATEVEVKLLPKPESVRTLLAIFDRIEDAGKAVTSIMARGLLPAALEIIDGATIRAVEASVFAGGYPVDANAALVVEFDGIEKGLGADVQKLFRTAKRLGLQKYVQQPLQRSARNCGRVGRKLLELWEE